MTEGASVSGTVVTRSVRMVKHASRTEASYLSRWEKTERMPVEMYSLTRARVMREEERKARPVSVSRESLRFAANRR